MNLLEQNGTAYDRVGAHSAPAVVLVHGLGLQQACWQWTLPCLLDAGFQVITYDLYGHGQSVAPPEQPTLSLFARQLEMLLSELQIHRATIVGFSLGGMIARRFAQDHPETVAALAILNSPYLRTQEAQAKVDARVRQAEREGPQATVEDALERWFTPSFRLQNPDMMELVRGFVTSNDKTVYPAIYKVLAEGLPEITSPVPPISCRTLVMTGDEDFGNGPEMAAAIAAEIKGSRLHILQGLRHMALAESPMAVNEPLVVFLKEAFNQSVSRNR